jgi:hypothetical protein
MADDPITDASDSTKKLARHILDAEKSSKDFVENFKDSLDVAKLLTKTVENLFNEIEKNQLKLNKNNEILKKVNGAIQSNLAKQAAIEASITSHQQERNKLSGDLWLNEEKKLDLSKQLLAIESEMDDAQMRAIHNEEDLSEEYSKMMQVREKIMSDQKKNSIEGASLSRKLQVNERQLTEDIGKRNKLGEQYNKLVERKNKLEDNNKGLESAIDALEQQVFLVKWIQLAYERFVELDRAAESFRKETGFSNTQMVELRSNAESVNRQFQDMGVSIEKAYASAKALTDVFGRTSLVTKETLGNVALLSANLGVAEADSANVLANFQGLGGATQEAAMNVIKVGAGISEKAGIPFKLVMNDIANASEQTTAMLGANPSKLMKSAIAARALGTDMNKIVSSQRKLLDYSSSINDELETSALLGRSISFQKSRQLAYDGDIVGAARATLETVKRAGDFEKMSVYQREALAKAAGMELKDLTKMIAVEKQRDAILLGGDQAAKDKLLAQEAELENLKNMTSLDDANLVKQNEKVLMQQKMQGMMSNFANTFQSLLVSLADILEPVVRVVAMILLPAFKIVSALIRGMLKPILNIGQALMGNAENTKKFAAFAEKVSAVMVTVYDWSEKIGEVIGEIFLALNRVTGIARLFGSNFDAVASTAKLISSLAGKIGTNFGFLKTIFQSVVPIVEFIASGFSRVYNLFKPLISMASNFFGIASKGASFVGPFVKVFGMIAKFAGPIGLIINAVQVVVDLVGQWMDIWSSEDMDLGDKLLQSFLAIPSALFNVLISPFIDLGVWIARKFGADIPDDMVEGIKSVGREITQWLLMPFVKAYEWLKKTFLGNSPSEIGLMIVDGIKAIGGMLLDVITFPFRTAFNFISGIFGGDGDLGDTIIDGVKSIAGFVFDVLTWPHRKLLDFVSDLFGGDGDIVGTMIDGIKTAAGFIFDVLTLPFRSIVNFISGIFGGDGNLGTSIVDGIKSSFGAAFDFITSAFSLVVDSIKNAASEIFGFITSPFKKALDFVKNIPFIGKLFGGNDIAAESKPQIDSTTMETAGVIEVKNLDALREVVQQLTDAVANLGKSDKTETLTAGTKIDTSALEDKLDKLTDLLVGGAVRVYLDGSDVSAAMSATGR